MEEKELKEILHRILPSDGVSAFAPFRHEEDEENYDAWKVTRGDWAFVLKRGKEYEAEAYRAFFREPHGYAPEFYGETAYNGHTYILIEYVEGKNLQTCSRETLTYALNALIAMQERHWGDEKHAQACYTFEKSAADRRARRNYLNDPRLEAVYDRFLELYNAVPRTLCHDDLLPFNVLVSNDRAVVIDWEFCGILPYLSPLARLIAHGEENPGAFFYMAESDRAFASQYFYDNFASKKGIAYAAYREALDYFLFYEYCEWVFVGNKYGDTENERYRRYKEMALEMAYKLNA